MSNSKALTATCDTDATATATRSLSSVVRSIGAVFADLVTTFVLTTAIDVAFRALGTFPPFGVRMADSLFVIALAYRIPFNAAGSYVTARVALNRPMNHALALGITGIVLATAGAIAMGKYGPAWYSLANIVIALPCAWFGGRLYGRSNAAHAT